MIVQVDDVFGEICLFGTLTELSNLGQRLIDDEDDFTLDLEIEAPSRSPAARSLRALAFGRLQAASPLLQIDILNETLHMRGNYVGLANFGESLVGFFREPIADSAHMHLSYLTECPEASLLMPTEYELIVALRRE